MKTPKPIFTKSYHEVDEIGLLIESATEFFLCTDGQGNAIRLKWFGSGWVIVCQESYYCKDKTFKHKNDIIAFEYSMYGDASKAFMGKGWEHVYSTVHNAIEAFRRKDLPELPKGKEFYEKVYDILVELGGAPEDGYRDAFVYNYTEEKFKSNEWRFQGKLGFGGKYRGETNMIDCYTEDETPERLELIKTINEKLKDLQYENAS